MLIIFYNSDDKTIYITSDCGTSHYSGKEFDTDGEDSLDMDLHRSGSGMRLYTEHYENDEGDSIPYIEAHLPFVFNEWIPVDDMTDDEEIDIVEFFKQFKDIKVVDAKMLNRFVLVPDLETF